MLSTFQQFLDPYAGLLQRAGHAQNDGKGRALFDRLGAAQNDGGLFDLIDHTAGPGALRVVVAGRVLQHGREQPAVEGLLGDVLRIDDAVHDVQVGHGVQQPGEVLEVLHGGDVAAAVQGGDKQGAGSADSVDTGGVHQHVEFGLQTVEGELRRGGGQGPVEHVFGDVHPAFLEIDPAAAVGEDLQRLFVLDEYAHLIEHPQDGKMNLIHLFVVENLVVVASQSGDSH